MEVAQIRPHESHSLQEAVLQQVALLHKDYQLSAVIQRRASEARSLLSLPRVTARRVASDVTKRLTSRIPGEESEKERLISMTTSAVDAALTLPQQKIEEPIGRIERTFQGFAHAISDGAGKKNPLMQFAANTILDLWEQDQKGEPSPLLTPRNSSLITDAALATLVIFTFLKVQSSIRQRKPNTTLNAGEILAAAITATAGTAGRAAFSETLRGVGEYLVANELQRDPQAIEERFRHIALAKTTKSNVSK